ncbi:hypothetical protein [Methanospirillum sp.]
MPHTQKNGIGLTHSDQENRIRSSSGMMYPQYSFPQELRRGIYC